MPTKNIADACSILRDLVPELLLKYNGRYEYRVAKVGEVLRTTAEQQDKWASGRTKPGKIITHADGVSSLSSHQIQTFHGEEASHAVDIDIFYSDTKQYIVDEKAYWPLVGLAICTGLNSGGEWHSPDLPHLFCPFAKP